MALTEPVNRIDEFISNYELITVEMIGANSFQSKVLESISSIFDSADISTEQRGIILAELAKETAISYNKDAVSASLELIRMSPEFEVKASQRDLFIRQKQGYDDNMLIKVSEQQSNLASFAVNANSDTAQSTINDLKAKISAIETRVVDINGGNCPTVVPVTDSPTNLVATNVTDTSITISWNAVLNASIYLVYLDGVLVSTQGALIFQVPLLTPETKYAFSVKASINGILSDHTDTLVVETIATV